SGCQFGTAPRAENRAAPLGHVEARYEVRFVPEESSWSRYSWRGGSPGCARSALSSIPESDFSLVAPRTHFYLFIHQRLAIQDRRLIRPGVLPGGHECER